LNFFKIGDKKILLILVITEKNQNHKSQFSDKFCRWAERRIDLGINLGKIPWIFYSKEFFLGSSLSRPSYLCRGKENWTTFFTCNVTKKYFVTLFFISLRYVIRYVTVFNFSLRYRVTLHKFFVTLRFFRYVTFRVQIPAFTRSSVISTRMRAVLTRSSVISTCMFFKVCFYYLLLGVFIKVLFTLILLAFWPMHSLH
jgi:hypothetical protein